MPVASVWQHVRLERKTGILSETEYQTLQDMINRRYDRKIQQYERGEKNWEFRIATTVLISGTKP